MLDWWISITVFIVLLIGILMTGAPLFVGFLIVIVLGVLYLLGDAGFGMIVNSMYETANTASLGTVPLFILLGEILFRSGSVQVLMKSIDRLIGRIRGRQYVLSISIATVLGALSGSSIAVGAMMSRSLLPEMRARHYDLRLSVGTILGGAVLAPIIPPSIVAIIIGSLANVSIASLLIAGILPGIIMASLYVLGCMVKIRLDPSLAPLEEDRSGDTETSVFQAIGGLIPFTGIIFMVMGLIMLGITTPSESAATGVVAGIATAAYYRKLSFKMLYECLSESILLAAIILMIFISAVMFTQLLAFTGATSAITQLVSSLDVNPYLMLFILLLIPFVMCMFVEQLGLMLIIIPIYMPIISVYEFDPVWFWFLFLIDISLGSITPPFGYVMFAVKAATNDISIGDIYRGSWLFVCLTLVATILFAIFPSVVTYLPNALGR